MLGGLDHRLIAARLSRVEGKTRDIIDLKDPAFGAKGDGVTNDQAAVTAWLLASAGLMGFAPAGTYMVDSLAPSANTRLMGAGQSVTVFKARAAANSPVVNLASKSDITLEDFGIEGNSANQTAGDADGVRLTNGNRIRCKNVRINDVFGWGFAFLEGGDIRLFGCSVTNGKGGVDPSSVRGGYLFGSSVPSTLCNDVVVSECTVSGTGTTIYFDGFMSENGTDHRFIGCRASVPYSGFKLKGDRVSVVGCQASSCLVGFQTQTSTQGLVLNGNTAWRCSSSGYLFNQLTAGTPARNWSITGNLAIENGQDAAASTRYGFAFEVTAACTVDGVTMTGNIARDTQGAPTQVRGFSWANTGTVKNLLVSGNVALGHTADWLYGTAIEQTSVVIGPNAGLTGSSAYFTPAQAAHELHFWVDNVGAAAGGTMSDGFGGRGYLMPRAGYVLTQHIRASAPVTAGTFNTAPQKNGVAFTSNTLLNAATPSYNFADETPRAQAFVAGDMITANWTSTAGLLPAGTNDFDLVIEVVYT